MLPTAKGNSSCGVQQQKVDHWLSLSADVIKACRYASAPHQQRYHIMNYTCYDTFTVVDASNRITAEMSGEKPDFLYACSK